LGSAADGGLLCLAHLSLLLSQQTRSPTVTSSLSSGLFEIHNCAQSVYSCVRLHDMKTDMKCVVQSKV
jgi:hypothetical protein